MKKFNKVRTVKMQVNAEVLPLNTTFVARMMNAKQQTEFVIQCLENHTKPSVENVQQILGFFNDLYEAIVEEEDKPVESKTKHSFVPDDDLFGGDAPIGTREQPKQVI